MIIGSEAIKYWFRDFPREPKDLDIVGDYKLIIPTEKRLERLNNPILQEYYKGVNKYLPPDLLYTLKISHSFWNLENGSWAKHMWDINFLKEKGCKFIPELFYKLFDYWETIHGKRISSDLNMSAEDFFNNALPKEYSHDSLHEVLIQHPYFNGQLLPTYTKVLKDGAEVDVDENKFNLLTEKEKFNLTFEEVAVMSWEKGRYPEDMYWKRKYSRMLKKFILSHCCVWQGIWIIQNYKELLNPPFNFDQHLKQQLLICN